MNPPTKNLGTLRINGTIYTVVANLGFDQATGFFTKRVRLGNSDVGQTHTAVSRRRDQGWRIQG